MLNAFTSHTQTLLQSQARLLEDREALEVRLSLVCKSRAILIPDFKSRLYPFSVSQPTHIDTQCPCREPIASYGGPLSGVGSLRAVPRSDCGGGARRRTRGGWPASASLAFPSSYGPPPRCRCCQSLGRPTGIRTK